MSPIDRVEVDIGVEKRKAVRAISHSRSQTSASSAYSSELPTNLEKEEETPRQSSPRHPSSLRSSYTHSQSIDELIESTTRATVLDMDHLPARTWLGHLYRLKGELALAEHWLERACTHTKYRGVGGGISSVFGGATSPWGWLSWKLLADVLEEEGRLNDAKKSILFSLELQKCHCIRGYECLPRFSST
jgi:hypothetical protein